MENAKNLIDGIHYLEEENDEEKMRGLTNMGVSMAAVEPVLIGRDGLNQQLRLEEFEEAVK